MHAFTVDGKHVVFLDGFGLTRLTLPRNVKTDRKLGGHWLSLGNNRVIVHTERTNRKALRAVDSLATEPLNTSDFSPQLLHPDGEHLLRFSRPFGLDVWTLAGQHARSVDLARPAPDAGTLALGPTLPRGAWRDQELFAVGPDGTVAVWFAHDNRLHVGRLADALASDWEPIASATLAPVESELTVWPAADATLVQHHAIREQVAYLARLTPGGRVEHARVPSLSPPCWAGDRLVWQPSAGELASAPWGSLGSPALVPLRGADGPGEIMAHRETVLFVPPEREAIVHVASGTRIDRKLPAAERDDRLALEGVFARYRAWLAHSGGHLRLTGLDPKGTRAHPSATWSLGNSGLSAYLAIGSLVTELRQEHGQRYGLGSYHNSSHLRGGGLDEVRAALAHIDRHGGALLGGLGPLQHPLRERFLPFSGNRARPVRPAPLFTPEAGRALLWAILETIDADRDLSLVDRVDELAARPLTPADLIARRWAPTWQAPSRARWFDAPLTVCWLALDHLGAAVGPVLEAWLVDTPCTYAASNQHIVADVAAAMILSYPDPAARASFVAACERLTRSGDATRANHGRALFTRLEQLIGAAP